MPPRPVHRPDRLRRARRRGPLLAALLLAIPLLAIPTTAAADPGAPWDGTPISAGLGPTYGEDWCQPPDPGTAIAGLQGPPLAIIPYEAIHCTVDQILAEGVAAGLPARATYEVNTLTDTGREQLAVVVNALETPEQQRDYERWTQVRELMTSDPAEAQALLATFGADVKMPIFIEANIHGGEREGTDAMLQVLRDLVTTPYGDHPVVDDVLDHSIIIVIPSQNPDGRYLGTRANSNGFDMNRDLLVQSQPEIRANIRLQLEWLAPVMFAMHGYVNPTLIDGLTKPHNPGLEYDIFANWNQRRLDENELDFAVIEQSLTRPVNDYGPNGGQQANIATTNGATQTGTTVTIQTTAAHGLSVGQARRGGGCGRVRLQRRGRGHLHARQQPLHLSSWRSRALRRPARAWSSPAARPSPKDGTTGARSTPRPTARSSASTAPRSRCAAMPRAAAGWAPRPLSTSVSTRRPTTGSPTVPRSCTTSSPMAIRNVSNAPRVPCCDDPFLAERGFDEENHDWMVPYPKAFVIPSSISPGGQPLAFDDGQRSQSESNRLAQWLLDNGVQLHRTTKDYVYAGQTIAKHSYVVFPDQFQRGFAYTSLAAGQDISERITQLYAPPGAWSHGQLWGADTIEVPAGATFAPKVEPITELNPQVGGVRGGGKADWYALAIRGTAEARAVLDLLRDGIDGEIADAAFTSASAGSMPAGSVLFANTPANVAALTAAGLDAGVWFERVLTAAKPATTQLDEAPKIAVLVNSAAPTINDTMHSLQRIFGSDARFISTIAGNASLQNAAADPLADIDVIYNTGQNYPATVNISAAPAGATQSGTTATIQTTAAHNLAVGSTVTVSGVGVAGYNGTVHGDSRARGQPLLVRNGNIRTRRLRRWDRDVYRRS